MSSPKNTKSRIVRSQIRSELVNQGFVKYSREYNAAFQRELRRRCPEIRAKEQAAWKRYATQKGKKWNAERIAKWRYSNPSKWQALMKRASENGLHRRFYEKHCERVKVEKREYAKRKRRDDPLFGFRATIAKFKRGEITFNELFEKCWRAFAYLDGKNEVGGGNA